MIKIALTDADIARLEDERAQADRAYNEALTGVDRALTGPPSLPGALPSADAHRLEDLNRGWEIVPATPVAVGGWKGRLATFVWRLVGPMLQRQQEFNAALVDHVNRTHAHAIEVRDGVARLADAVTDQLGAQVRFQARLIQYLQQITLYVDTKDRYEDGLLRYMLEHEAAGLAAGLNGLGDELLKRWESALARERRYDARVEELKQRVAELRRVVAAGGAGAGTLAADAGSLPAAPLSVPQESLRRDALADAAHAGTYASFEDRYRGSVEEIEGRQAEYLPLFAGARDVLDIGCGRGEFLQLLAGHGIPARGVEVNGEMVRRCRERGLDVAEAEGLTYLESLPDASLGGLFAGQVVEHLQPDHLLHLIALARRKLRPGARIVLETINPACWAAFFSSYIRDLTHVRPVHPETLAYLLTANGFDQVDIRYSSPYPAEARLQPLSRTLRAEGPAMTEVVEQFNRNVETLNGLLFTYLDYAAVGERKATTDQDDAPGRA